MRAIFLLFFINASMGFGLTLTGPELINPSVEEISRCVPETMQEPVIQAIKDLPKAAKITQTLYKTVAGAFSKNCKILAKRLAAINMQQLLQESNISPKFSVEDAHTISVMLKDKNTGLRNFLYIMSHLDLHLLGYVSALHGSVNRAEGLDIVDLNHCIDLIQLGVLELHENLQLLSYLSLAYRKIPGYGAILEGMRHQLFKITAMVNSLAIMTQDLRSTYLSLLDKGDCNGDQVTLALGLKHKQITQIDQED